MTTTLLFGIGVQTSLEFATFAIIEDDAASPPLAAIQVAESTSQDTEAHTTTHFYLSPTSARRIAEALQEWANKRDPQPKAEIKL